jgi:hypothetical protein
VSAITPLAAGTLDAGNLVGDLQADDLVYFCLNVGDADAQLLLLPEDSWGKRRAIVVDAGMSGKVNHLIEELVTAGLLSFGTEDDDLEHPLALVVATHPHDDHMRGIPAILDEYEGRIAEYWDAGYYHTLGAFSNAMRSIEKQQRLVYAQPTSGFMRWFDDVAITVLAPSIQLRNRYDTYGVEINDSSVTLRVEYPATRVRTEEGRRTYAPNPKAQRLILGADAQTLSWSYVLTDFPDLGGSDSEVAKKLRIATGDWDALSANVFKVSHHASKHGVNLELLERIHPSLTIVSSTDRGSTYKFPHAVTQELIREALDPVTSSGKAHKADAELGVVYTCDTDSNDDALGSIAVVLRPGSRRVWRLGDRRNDDVSLGAARLWSPP